MSNEQNMSDKENLEALSSALSNMDKFLHKCGQQSEEKMVYLTEENSACIFPCIELLKERNQYVYIEFNYRPFINSIDFTGVVAFQDTYHDRVKNFTRSSKFKVQEIFPEESKNEAIIRIRKLPTEEQEMVLQGAIQILSFNYLALNEEKEFTGILKRLGR